MQLKLEHHCVSALWLLCTLVRGCGDGWLPGSLTTLTNHIPDTDTLEEVEDLALSKLAASEINVPNQTPEIDKSVPFLPLGLRTPKKGN